MISWEGQALRGVAVGLAPTNNKPLIYTGKPIEPEPKTIADRIKSFGDEADKTLESVQTSASKIGKRLVAMIVVIGVGLTAGYQTIKGFREKIQSILESGSIEKLEEKPGSKVFKVKGRADSKDTTEFPQPPEK